MEKGGTSRVTTAPAPTILPLPIVTPGNKIAPVPMSAHASTCTGRISRSVSMIGRSMGRPVCEEPKYLCSGPPTHIVLKDQIPRVKVGLGSNPNVISNSRNSIEASLNICIVANEYSVPNLESFQVLEANAAANPNMVSERSRQRPPDTSAHQLIEFSVSMREPWILL